LKTIQENSGANVKVPKKEDMEVTSVIEGDENEEDFVEITIEGIDTAVSKAKDDITKIIDEKVIIPIPLSHPYFKKFIKICRLRKRRKS